MSGTSVWYVLVPSRRSLVTLEGLCYNGGEVKAERVLIVDVERLRQEIPTTQKVVYMNTGWSGPSPRVVLEAMKDFMAFENTTGPASRPVVEEHRQRLEEAQRRVAQLIGASEGEVCLLENTTEGINVVINGLRWAAGDEVVTCSLEHPSGLLPCYFLQQRFGVQAKVVELDFWDSAGTILNKLAAALSERTRLLCLSHVMYTNGLRLPLREVNALAHQKGALVLVDAAQSVGQMAVDVKALDCDFYALPGQKWLLGPDGTAALYVRKDLIPMLEPAKVAHRAAITYDLAGHYQPNRDEIQKFELTTRNVALFVGLTRAIAFLEELGWAGIERRIGHLVARLRDGFQRLPGVMVYSPRSPELASGLVSFSVEGITPETATQALWERARIVARSLSYPPSTRLSLHCFNTDQEVDLAVQTVATLCREGRRGSEVARDVAAS